MHEQLLAVTPIDGRYADKVSELSPYMSEFGLIKSRLQVEIAWLSLLGSGILPDKQPLSNQAQQTLKDLSEQFSVEDAVQVKKIEAATNHDVKAVEVWLRDNISDHQELSGYSELIHFGCTSEDINNLAYAIMLKSVRDDVLVPSIGSISEDLGSKSADYASVPMLSLTHGQPATPTTLGKEMAVFKDRLDISKEHMGKLAIIGKFNGASGNYNAAAFAYPAVEWPRVNKEFVENLGFEFNPTTTQIEPHDWIARYCHELSLSNTIMKDLSTDIWLYIMRGVFKLKPKKGEVGSSTMPHKVNPIDFENAEANFGLANATLGFLAEKLPSSRQQRDLSDSSALRALSEAVAHSLIGQKSMLKGLSKVEPDLEKISSELKKEWPILTEALQTVMRRYGVDDAYEIIKQASRGKTFTKATYIKIVNKLDIPAKAKKRLLALTPEKYIGLASEITKDSLNKTR